MQQSSFSEKGEKGEIPTRAEIARVILASKDDADVSLAGCYAMVIACARSRDTMQESVDLFRDVTGRTEDLLRLFWDQLRRL